LSRGFTGGKREREATRARRKKEKADRLRMNREHRPAEGADAGLEGLDPSQIAALPAVNIEDVVIGVASRPRRESTAPVKLFIGGLSWDTNTEDLKAAFSNFGRVVDAVVIQDRNTGRSRGFGFVTYEKGTDAEEAVKQMNGKELDGRALKVNRAESP
jgi:hypothetical protein